MRLTVIDSGSSGNCYVLDNAGDILLLDAGVHIKRILAAVNYKPSAISGVLLTHEHKDHSKAVDQLLFRGVRVYATKGTAIGAMLDCLFGCHSLRCIEYGKLFRIPGYAVKAFETVHDALEPAGYLVHAGGLKIAYVTDSAYVPVKFKGLDYLIIECDYADADSIQGGGKLPNCVKRRIVESHMNIDTAARYIAAMDKSRLKGIILAHMSQERGDAAVAITEISNAADGVRVQIAEPGLEIKI